MQKRKHSTPGLVGRTLVRSRDTDGLTSVPLRLILFFGLLCSCLQFDSAKAQVMNQDSIYQVEMHLEFGPLFSHYINGRPLPEGSSPNVIGYNAMLRLMWHPNHALAVGLFTGSQLLVAEKYTVAGTPSTGSLSDRMVHASLHAMPIMFDVSRQSEHFEAGLALGGYIIKTHLEDITTTEASRFELGMIGHASYHWNVVGNLSLGPELVISYMSYRGIVSIAPQIDVRFVPFHY